jgi:membrane-associated protease RseP (regulator of RpoE activity)
MDFVHGEKRKLGAAIVIALTATLFYFTLVSPAGGILKFIISLILMAGCGICLKMLLRIEGEKGLLLLRTKKGLQYIDNVANVAPRLWQACADFGTVLGFGISSVFFFKKLPKKTFMFSILALILSSQLMAPKVFTVVVSLINLPVDLTTASDQMGTASTLLPFIVVFAMLFFGFCGITIVGLIMNTYSILSNTIGFMLSVPGKSLAAAIPGASPIIPGINMPLLEGILALGVLLFVHEVAHGILSRIGKVKLESAGVLLFGLIPVGAFVDPDEKSLVKKDVDAQTRVFAAGSASNLILFIIAFFILIGFESLTASHLDPGVYVGLVERNSSAYDAGVRPGDLLVAFDSVPITWSNIGQFNSYISSKESVMLQTDKGTFALEPKALVEGGTKIIGIGTIREQRYLPAYSWLGFIKNTLGLIFILNFLVGIINLIPLFMAFDGYRIFALHQKDARIVKFVSYSLLIMFILNFVPWLWR